MTVSAPIAATTAVSWACHDWRFGDLCGAILTFGWADMRAQVRCVIAPSDEAAVWTAATKCICFDPSETHTMKIALRNCSPSCSRKVVQDGMKRVSAETHTHKPVATVEKWAQAEAYLRRLLDGLHGKTLVLINQPFTSADELKQHCLAFASKVLRKPVETGETARSLARVTP